MNERPQTSTPSLEPHLSGDEGAELWDAWRRHRSPVARDALVRNNLRLVQHVAGQLIRTGSARGSEMDDLVSAGTVGLLQAVESFEPERGLSFSTFATPRIRGAILDDLRRQDPAPRSVRRKQRELAQVRERLSARLSRPPSDQEVAAELGVDPQAIPRLELDAAAGEAMALDPLPREGSRGPIPLPNLEEGVEERLGREDEVRLLTQAIQELRHPDRLVITLYYHEGLRMHQIAEVLGVTESRVSQLRSRALRELRSRLSPLRS